MKLSIITINYNNASGLLKTARSIASLTFNDYEWLVIDGGSIDSSLQIIKEYNHLSPILVQNLITAYTMP